MIEIVRPRPIAVCVCDQCGKRSQFVIESPGQLPCPRHECRPWILAGWDQTFPIEGASITLCPDCKQREELT